VALSDESPLVLVVDDVHWADGPSLQALAYLARRVEELPIAILLATRSDLAADLPNTIRDEATVVVRPNPLSRPAGDGLVRTVLGDATPAFLDACHHAAGGNPLLVKALLAALQEDEVRPDESGLAAVRRHAQAIVATFVLARLRHLPPQAGAMARAVAVLGRNARLRRAAELAELAPKTALEAADALVAAQLLAPGRPLTFIHPLIAEAVSAHMSEAVVKIASPIAKMRRRPNRPIRPRAASRPGRKRHWKPSGCCRRRPRSPPRQRRRSRCRREQHRACCPF